MAIEGKTCEFIRMLHIILEHVILHGNWIIQTDMEWNTCKETSSGNNIYIQEWRHLDPNQKQKTWNQLVSNRTACHIPQTPNCLNAICQNDSQFN